MANRKYYYAASAFFRRRRNRALEALIASLHSKLDRSVRVLDVGGLPDFWDTIRTSDKCTIVLLNSEKGEYSTAEENQGKLRSNMSFEVGDACALDIYDQDVFDLVVSNSMIEHVGSWSRMREACSEMKRVGSHGWIQVPAFEFPLEVLFMVPFVHWLAEPIRGAILRRCLPRFRGMSINDMREMLDYVKLITRRELEFLIPGSEIHSERFIGLPKSHIATW